MKIKKSHGFTLLEILLVVGIIAILAGIVIVAINPSRQLAQVRNTERLSDVKQINSAVMQYYIDKGYFPTTISTTSTEICNTDSGEWGEHEVDCTDLVDLSMLVPVYLTAIPVDPQGGAEVDVGFLNKIINKVYAATNGTNYWIKKNSTGKIIETTADGAELGVTISIPAGISNSGGDDEEEEVVVDSIMSGGLEWLNTDAPGGKQNYATGAAACASMSTAGGFKPGETWFLPSKDALKARYDVTGSLPEGFQSDYYWSGTVNEYYDLVYVVGMYNRNENLPPRTNTYYVRCVR